MPPMPNPPAPAATALPGRLPHAVPGAAPGPDVFLMGVSKAASTWIHRCLREHPGVFVPEDDSLRFFDLDYPLGLDHYLRHFQAAPPGSLCVDASPTYLRSPVAAERIARHFPNARFLLSLRDPVERAFSQFWHEKKQGRLDYSFEEAIGHFLFFPWIVEHGFYAAHVRRLLQHFPRERITVVLYDDLVADPRLFLDQVLDALELPRDFSPSVLNKRVNEAGNRQTASMQAVKKLRGKTWLRPVRRMVKTVFGQKNLMRELGKAVSDREEYDRGMSATARARLIQLYAEDLAELEGLLGLTLQRWRMPIVENVSK